MGRPLVASRTRSCRVANVVIGGTTANVWSSLINPPLAGLGQGF
jgi:hypothetical protein